MGRAASPAPGALDEAAGQDGRGINRAGPERARHRAGMDGEAEERQQAEDQAARELGIGCGKGMDEGSGMSDAASR